MQNMFLATAAILLNLLVCLVHVNALGEGKNDEIAALKEAVAKVQNDSQYLQKENKLLKEAVAKVQNDSQYLQKENKLLKEAVAKIQNDSLDLQKENKLLKEAVAKQENDSLHLQKENELLTEKLDNVTSQVARNSESVSNVATENDRQEDSITQVVKIQMEQYDAIDNVIKENDVQDDEIANAIELSTWLNQSLWDTIEKNAKQDDSIAKVTKQNIRLNDSLRDVIDRNTQQDDSIAKVIKQNTRQDDAIENANEQNNRQDASIEEIKKGGSAVSSHCRLLPKDVCGNCTCIDDYRSDNYNKYFCDCQRLPSKRDCLEHYQHGNRNSGVYAVNNNHMKDMLVYCDQETDNGGWTVFQRRVDGSTNFYENWNTYKEGFGQPSWNFWLGLENMYVLSVQAVYPKGSELRVDMKRWDGTHLYAKYSHVNINDESTFYKLSVSGYSGDSGDNLAYHNDRPFGTYDQLAGSSKDCPKTTRGGWWYGRCFRSHLNGEYVWKDAKSPGFYRGILWGGWAVDASLKYADMKMRRVV